MKVHKKVLDIKYKYPIYKDLLSDTNTRRRTRSRSRSNSDHNLNANHQQQQQQQHSSSPVINTTIDINHFITSNERDRRRRNSSVGSSDSGTKELLETPLYDSFNYKSFDDNTALKKTEIIKLGINSVANKVLLTPLADIPNAR